MKLAWAALVVAVAAAGVLGGLYATKSPGTKTTAPCGEQHLFGYIRSLAMEGDTYRMRFDPAIFTTGRTANIAAAEDHVIAPGEPMPNDNYVVNESKRVYLYLVPPSTPVRVLTPASNVDGSQITVAQLAQLAAGEKPVKLFEGLETGFWMWVHGDTACDLQQQYRP
jgi:hypothetical protein